MNLVHFYPLCEGLNKCKICIFVGTSTVGSFLQAKGTKSPSFLTCVRNEVDLVPMACEDAVGYTS